MSKLFFKTLKPFIPSTALGGIGGTILTQQYLKPETSVETAAKSAAESATLAIKCMEKIISAQPPTLPSSSDPSFFFQTALGVKNFAEKSKWNMMLVAGSFIGIGIVWKIGWNRAGWLTKKAFRKAMTTINTKFQTLSQKITTTQEALEQKIVLDPSK